jgi:hypothetical protein
VWNTVSRGPAPFQEGTLFKKKSVVYYTGTKHTPLTPGELDSLTSCLDAGCNLFITGQDFVEKNDSSALLRDYLGVRFAGNSGFILSSGVSGDLFSGFSFLTLGTPQTSANDQVSRDSLRVTNPRAKVAMTYGGIGIAAVRLDSAGAGGKAVVMGFGFEAINSAATRKNVMQKIIGYFDGSIVLGVGEESGGLPPRAFKLEQNYPDPFNPTTVIVFELPRESRVKLTVYDLLGREIRILEEGTRPAGRSEILFNAAGLPSGVYCYRLQAVPLAGAPLLTPSFSGVKKMVLLK